MTDDVKRVALTTEQRALVGRIQAAKASGSPLFVEGDDMAVFLTPEIAATLDGTAVPEEERRDPMIQFIERPLVAEAQLRHKEVYLVEGHSALMRPTTYSRSHSDTERLG